jgi:hypothetical protein
MSQLYWGMTPEAWNAANVIGTWVSGIASTVAVVTALYLAGRTNSHRARFTVSLIHLHLNTDEPHQFEEAIQFSITNIGERRIVVSELGWQVGVFKQDVAYQGVGGVVGAARLPAALEHGESVDWVVYLGKISDPDSWIRRFSKYVLQDRGEWGMFTLQARAVTTVGKTFVARPNKGLRNKLYKALDHIAEQS